MCTKLQKIDDYAFRECSKLSSLKLPEGLNLIGSYSFAYTKIISVKIPSTVTTISSPAFWGCTSLSSVELDKNCLISTLSGNVFNSCPIKTFHFPASVKNVNGGTFSWNTVMIEMSVDPESKYLWTDGISLYSYDRKSLLYVIPTLKGEYRVEDSIISIAYGCFINSQLSSVWMSDNVKSLGIWAFSFSNINSVNLSNSIKIIDTATFHSCRQLKNIVLPSSLTTINLQAFQGSGILSINVPEGVTKIDNSAFAGCQNLLTINIPSTLKQLGGGVTSGSPKAKYVFKENSSVYILNDILLMDRDNTSVSQYFGIDQTSVVIPSTVKTIRSNAFKDKRNLQTVTSDGDIHIEVIEEYAFAGCINLANFITFVSIITIARSAFQDSNINVDIVFGESLTLIDIKAFYNCTNIRSISFRSMNKLTINDEAFYNCQQISSVNFDQNKNSINIGNNIFNSLFNLLNVKIPNSIIQVGYNCFSNCGLQSVTFDLLECLWTALI